MGDQHLRLDQEECGAARALDREFAEIHFSTLPKFLAQRRHRGPEYRLDRRFGAEWRKVPEHADAQLAWLPIGQGKVDAAPARARVLRVVAGQYVEQNAQIIDVACDQA